MPKKVILGKVEEGYVAHGNSYPSFGPIVRITGGNFRLFQRLFAQIGRILQVNHLSSITREVVKAARECLVIGAT